MRTAAAVVVAVMVLSLLAACSSSDDAGSAGERSGSSTTLARLTDQRGQAVDSPTVTGPVTGGAAGQPFLAMTPQVAAESGYTEEEYFLDGEATAYEADGPMGTDGRWSVTPTNPAHYRTRILVRRPADPEKFDGTVFVEWFNVTGGLDNDPGFGLAYPAMVDSGSAYVGVSAQKIGVEGGGSAIPIEGAPDEIPGLKQLNPERYGDLTHPGDAYSFDIFSQAAQVVRRPGDVDVLRGLGPQHLIAMGESQSAGRLVTYVNAVQPSADIYDGFLIHSRGGGGASLAPDGPTLGGGTVHIRDDMREPVLQFETETDMFGGLGFAAARQDDSDTLRTWEVAGTAHADQSILDYNAALAASFGLDLSEVCPVINDGPMAEVLRAAVAAVRTWVVDGEPAPTAPRFEVANQAIAPRRPRHRPRGSPHSAARCARRRAERCAGPGHQRVVLALRKHEPPLTDGTQTRSTQLTRPTSMR